MGIIEVESFCCGAFGLERGCKIIALITMAFSALLFFLSLSQGSVMEAHAAYLLLALTLMLLYGVIERVKMVVIAYLLLRALALVLVLAEIMRNLAGMKIFNEGKILIVMLEAGDFGESMRLAWKARACKYGPIFMPARCEMQIVYIDD